jgi:SAM-dependent methyltransferase
MTRTNPAVTTAMSERWADEYRNGGIPSSVRSRPSNVVIEFVTTVRSVCPGATHAFDIGSGTGRNSIYLAEQGYAVNALDYCGPQVDALAAFARSRPDLQLNAVEGSVTQPWPWRDASADFAVDAFCFKHQIEPEAIDVYLRELRRCLRPGGLYMLFLALREDGYYRQFPAPHQHGPGLIIVDRGNDIPSRLYAREEIETLFTGFRALHFAAKISSNQMHGRTYQRHSGVWHLQRI